MEKTYGQPMDQLNYENFYGPLGADDIGVQSVE